MHSNRKKSSPTSQSHNKSSHLKRWRTICGSLAKVGFFLSSFPTSLAFQKSLLDSLHPELTNQPSMTLKRTQNLIFTKQAAKILKKKTTKASRKKTTKTSKNQTIQAQKNSFKVLISNLLKRRFPKFLLSKYLLLLNRLKNYLILKRFWKNPRFFLNILSLKKLPKDVGVMSTEHGILKPLVRI